ncbi:hypothetical protein H8E07_09405 [bacterium]|nr:hypothetical protein [bacterium]
MVDNEYILEENFGEEENRLAGTAIWFGDGTIESFDRLPDQVDAMIIGRGEAHLTAARDGGPGRDVATTYGTVFFSNDLVVEAAGH